MARGRIERVPLSEVWRHEALDFTKCLEGKRACRIRHELPDGGYKDSAGKWPEIQDRMIDAMVRFEAAFRPHIAKLNA